jgi:hypothetical protein
VIAHVHQVQHLRPHDLRAADDPAQSALVQDGPHLRRVLPVQDFLTGHPRLGPPVDLVFRRQGAQPDHRAGVFLDLQQAGNELQLVLADEGGGGLKAEVRLDPVRQDVRVRLPPAGRVGSPGEVEQRLALVARADTVEGQQVGDVALLEPDPTVLHPADFGVRPADARGGLLGRHARVFAEPTQVSAEHEALHCRARRARAEQRLRSLLPGGVLGREHRYSSWLRQHMSTCMR